MHLLQISILIGVVVILLGNWPMFFVIIGIEMVSLWRHQLQHHPKDFFSKPAWFVMGLVVTFLGVYATIRRKL